MRGIDKSIVDRWHVFDDGVTVNRWQLRLGRRQAPPRFHSLTGPRRISAASMRHARTVDVAKAMRAA